MIFIQFPKPRRTRLPPKWKPTKDNLRIVKDYITESAHKRWAEKLRLLEEQFNRQSTAFQARALQEEAITNSFHIQSVARVAVKVALDEIGITDAHDRAAIRELYVNGSVQKMDELDRKVFFVQLGQILHKYGLKAENFHHHFSNVRRHLQEE